MKKIYIQLFVLLLLTFSSYGQRYTISGIVEDTTSGERMLGAFVYDSLSLKGTSTNYYGFYSLTLPSGKVRLICSFVGFNTRSFEFVLTKDTTLNIYLDPRTLIEEVIVTTSSRNLVRNTQMGLVELSTNQIKNLPVLMGESDIIKTIQLLPGVKGGTEGTSGMYVRGGGPDQNLVLLDGVPVYNPNHLFGFFSVFNSDAIQSFSLLKGGFPARYGGRLSSVLDIKMKEGNNKKFTGNASIGLISSKISFEGPIKKDTTSFLISARRTYLDVFPYLYQKAKGGDEIFGYYFYDINTKINHKFSNKSRIYYSFYTGLDKFYFNYNANLYKTKSGSGWGNDIHALRWNYVISDNLFANFTTTYSNYEFFIDLEEINNKQSVNSIKYNSGIRDWGTKFDFDYIPVPNHYIRVGGSYLYHRFNPGITAVQLDLGNDVSRIDTAIGNFSIYAHEFSGYFEDDIEITEKLKSNIGIHFSQFFVKKTNYQSIQPRISIRYLLLEKFSTKVSIAQMKQYVQLLTTANIGMPTDLWVPSTDKIPPMESWQYSAGFAYSPNDMYELSIEGYYKEMKNLIEYKEGASFLSINNSWENKVEIGKGTGKGIEFLLQKKTGIVNGWIGYTLAFANRQFENISFGKPFPYRYDIRHDIGVAVNYKPSENVDIGFLWIFMSGQAITIPEQQYISPDYYFNSYYQIYEHFEKRNNFRMPSYHRLDIAINIHKKLRYFTRTISFGLYNAYNRRNPFFVNFEKEWNNPDDFKVVLKQYSLFPIIPYVSLILNF